MNFGLPWPVLRPPADPRVVLEKARPTRLTPRPKEKARPRPLASPVEQVVAVDLEVVDLEQLEIRQIWMKEAAEYRAKRRRVQAEMYTNFMCCH